MANLLRMVRIYMYIYIYTYTIYRSTVGFGGDHPRSSPAGRRQEVLAELLLPWAVLRVGMGQETCHWRKWVVDRPKS